MDNVGELDEGSTSSYVDIPNVNQNTSVIASGFDENMAINGTYTKGDSLFGEKVYYVNADGKTFLKWHKGFWMFVPTLRTVEPIAQSSEGAETPAPGLVWSNTSGVLTGSITLAANAIPEVSPQTAFLENHWDNRTHVTYEAPHAIDVTGCVGHSEKLNGVYELSSDKRNGRVLFQKETEEGHIYIRWANGSWVFSSVLDDDLDSDEASYEEVQVKAFAIATEDVQCPTLVKSDWRILESFFGQYVPFPALNIGEQFKPPLRRRSNIDEEMIAKLHPQITRAASITSTKSVTFDPVEDVHVFDKLDDAKLEITGTNQLAGEYTKMDRRIFGRVCYEKISKSRSLFLRYHPAGAWVISDTLEDELEDEINDRALDPGAPSGMAVVPEDCVHPGQIKMTWQVFETYFGNYVDCDDMKVKCAAFPEEVEEEELEAMEDTDPRKIFAESPEPIVVAGFTGTNAKLNGTYWKGSQMHEDRVYYESNQHSIFLRYTKFQATWIFASDLSKNYKPLAKAVSEEFNVMKIGNIWEAPEAFFLKMAPCPNVTISTLKHQPQKRTPKTIVEAKEHRVTKREGSHGSLAAGFDIKAVDPANFDADSIEVVPGERGQDLGGIYLKAADEFNGKPFYMKKLGFITEEDEFMYICWHDSCQWIITTDITSLDAALAKTIDDTDFPAQIGSPWMVRVDEKFHADDDFTINAVVEAEFGDAQDDGQDDKTEASEFSEALDPAEMAVMLSQAPNQIVVIGREGSNDLINGTYNKGFCCHEDKVYYTHCDQSCVLRWHERGGIWIFSQTLSEDLDGFAACASEAFFPNDIKGTWKFYSSTGLTEDEGIKITDAKIVRRAISKITSRNKVEEPFMSHEVRQAYKNFSAPEDFPDLDGNKTTMAKVLTEEMYGQLRDRETKGGCTLDKTIQTGLDNPEQTGSGVLLGDHESYSAFAPLIDGILDRTHAGYPSEFEQETDWEISDSDSHCFDAEFVISCRAQIDRNLKGIDMPLEASRATRRNVQQILTRACSAFGVRSAEEMGSMEDEVLLQKRFAFRMNEPSAACMRDHPDGRSVFLGKSDAFSVWINEAQHCSIVVNEKSGNLEKTFADAYQIADRLQQELLKQDAQFAFDSHYGFLNSDPCLGGTGLKLSATCYLPFLCADSNFEQVLSNLRLAAVQLGEGKVEISNKECVGISEKFILKRMMEGLQTIVGLEKSLEQQVSIANEIPAKVLLPWSESSTKKFLRERIHSFMEYQGKLNEAGPAPKTIIIWGRVGMNNILNGLYMLGHEKFNSRPYWEKLSFDKVPVYIRWHHSGMWIMDSELVDSYKGMAFNKTMAVYPHLAENDWRIFARGHFVLDPDTKVTDHERGVRLDRDELQGIRIRYKSVAINDAPHAPAQKKIPLLRQLSIVDTFNIARRESSHNSAPEKICIVGEHPRALFTNGVYHKVENKLHNDRPIWRKSDGSYNCFIRWHTKGLWIISDFLNDRLGGFALVHDPTATNPTLAKRCWKIQAGGAGYIKHPNITAVAVENEDSAEHSEMEATSAKQSSVFE